MASIQMPFGQIGGMSLLQAAAAQLGGAVKSTGAGRKLALPVSMAAATVVAASAAPDLDLAVVWGKGDRKTFRGKKYRGSFGKARPRKPEASPWSQEYWGTPQNWAPPGSGRPQRRTSKPESSE